MDNKGNVIRNRGKIWKRGNYKSEGENDTGKEEKFSEKDILIREKRENHTQTEITREEQNVKKKIV